ncbi:MAG: N-acetyltransferase [Alphaproteobacteria bacterium]|nr:N-acetyltransferase [Alphaproteobacteria bacterium]
MTNDDLTWRIRGSAAEIGYTAWNACANPTGAPYPHPFTQYEFFDALEASGSAVAAAGWRPFHLVAEYNGGVAGLLPLYLKAHSQGEYVFDHAWAEALEKAGGNYYPKLQGCVPFTPVTGRRLLTASVNESATGAALLRAAATTARQLGISSLHITFLTEQEWVMAGESGYLQRTDRQFHWENRGYRTFDDFLGDLSSARRKNLRKERISIQNAGIEFDWLSGADLTEKHWDRFFAFYMDTGSRKWGRPYLTREFFSRIGQNMGKQILLIMARRGRNYIGAALNLLGDGIVYGRHWGCSEFVPFLHFETCYYQAIEYAIAHKFSRVEAGVQGEHKLLRGYRPAPTYSVHYITHSGLRRAVADFLRIERIAVQEDVSEMVQAMPFRNERS